jgi:4-hydroxythreonine-4-phosphate dehydrogenase
MQDVKAPIAITMGDPAGIGPEIIAKTLTAPTFTTQCVVIGDPLVMQEAIQQVSVNWSIHEIKSPEEANFSANTINLITSSHFTQLPKVGEINADNGKAAFDAIVTAIELAKADKVSALVTAPIHKESLSLAGIQYPGHTEILAHYCDSDKVAMMLANQELRTVLVSIHCSMREVLDRIDFDGQIQAIELAQQGAKALGFQQPRIAVAGLNPHAGEGGLFGREEIDIIQPAIKASQAKGYLVSGPWPGDTVFMQARQGKFDIVVAQYHDQGLIPVKYMGIEAGVNITLGLTFIRTSPDHGTAFDIAGKGIADHSSLETAISYATQLINCKNQGANHVL